MLQIVASLTDDSRDIIYDHNIFIIETTGLVSSKTTYKPLFVHIWDMSAIM